MVLPILGANTESAAYEISNSLRFNDDDSTYLSRTVGTPTNEKIYTVSVWVKKSNTGINNTIIGSPPEGDRILLGDKFEFFTNGSASSYLRTNAVARDNAAWYHMVVAYDVTQGTAANRVKYYINGEQLTFDLSTTFPSQDDTNGKINKSGTTLEIGHGHSGYCDGYMADFNLIDGQALDPTYFGETNSNGVWIPKKYTGTYGNNGFFLEFQQTGTSANASGMGADSSGNDNHLSITDLPSSAIMTESPNLTWAYLSQISASDQEGSAGNIENGGLRLPTGNKVHGLTHDNIMLDGGKWYFEVYMATSSNFNSTIGFRNNDNGDDGPSIEVENDRQVKKDSSNVGSSGGNFANGGVISVKLDWSDTTDRKVEFLYDNGAMSNAGEQTFTDTSTNSGFRYHGRETGSGSIQLFNFGQNPGFFGNISAGGNADANGYGNFQYSVPNGYYSINSKNLSEYGGL